jgi:hypothetical protein
MPSCSIGDLSRFCAICGFSGYLIGFFFGWLLGHFTGFRDGRRAKRKDD